MEHKEEMQNAGFEEKLAKVQELITVIENGKLPLEDIVKEYENGMKLLNELDSELNDINRRLTVLQSGKEKEMPHENL